jgi:hypothetical protein
MVNDLAYSEWLTSSLKTELARLKTELSRNEARRETLLAEYNRKWGRLRYQVRRIREIQETIRYLEDELDKSRGKPRERRIREDLSDTRASITPHYKRREDIIADINYERDTLLHPLESRIHYLQEQIKLIEDELARRRREEWIADEEITGLDIYYHLDEEVYHIRDPDTRELIRTEEELVIELTGSIVTEVGHDIPTALEITAITTIKQKDNTEIKRITRREGPLESGLIGWLVHEGWGDLARRLDSVDFAFLGKSIEHKRAYPCIAPSYPKTAIWIERKSHYVSKRRYPEKGCAEYDAE